jgi:hypothetical protein
MEMPGQRLHFVGQFVAYCMWQGELAEIPLQPSLWTLLLRGRELVPQDLMLDAPSTYGSFQYHLRVIIIPTGILTWLRIPYVFEIWYA